MTVDEICSNALRLMDEAGPEGLSMRGLAAELGVNPMSLYHHVPSKEALIGLVCSRVAERVPLPSDDGAPWQDQLAELALAYLRHAQAHPAVWAYIHSHPELIEDRRLPIRNTLDRVLRLAGVTGPELRRTSDVLYALVTGFVITAAQGHLPGGQDEIDRDFGTALRLIVSGVAGLS
ncbi:TetR/AcrR family transcriptional regulator [Nonomuraea sp. NPDC049695]|uniref:TetR/AcrR family transcriptional regulator n=1 Tax=Nonomuraea sp. NPDC049695 TaxID=3154734 RepID=UPI00343955AA